MVERYDADFVVAEGNQGGAMVKEVLRAAGVKVRVRVVHASRGKVARADPVVMLYEQGRVKHVREGKLSGLEDEQVTWLPGTKSPNRIDAAVWILTALLGGGAGGEVEATVF